MRGGRACAWCCAVSGVRAEALVAWAAPPQLAPTHTPAGLAGHSLGGAVAQLCMLRLLRTLRGALPPPTALHCIAFGAPAIGNAVLAAHVQQEG